MKVSPETLLAACDALVTCQLETLGKRIMSADRSRYSARRDTGVATYEVHTLWTMSAQAVDKSLAGLWVTASAVLSRLGLTEAGVERVVASLDTYVRELVQFRLPHELENLARRLGRDL